MLALLLLQVLASCLWLGHSEVAESFASCSQFFYAGTIPSDVLDPQKPAWICQRYSNFYHYATLYDRDRRIPVYSAYIYQPGPGNIHEARLVEPQLINSMYYNEMDTEDFIKKRFKINPLQIGQSQAINQDYKELQGLDHGLLNPSGHQRDDNRKWATFTLTNMVPMNSTLNKGAWKDYENQTMAQNTKGCKTTYVITGAVPGNNYISKKRVNVPSHIWSAACCLGGKKPRAAWGAIAENNKNEIQLLKLGELEGRLTKLYGGRTVTLFNNACPRK